MWRLVQLVAGGGMLAVLGAGALMVWPLLWPPDPDASVQLVNGRLLGEATGYVGHIDRDARTVDVSASLVGWRPVVLVVDEATAIRVHNRRGGFGDLGKDMPVRVSYEVIGDRRLARSIDVVAGNDGQSRSVVNGAVTPALVAPPVVAPPATVTTPPMDFPVPAGAADPGLAQPAPEPPAASAVASPPPATLSPVPEPSRREELATVKPAPAPELAPAKPAPVPEPSRRASAPPAKPSPTADPPRPVAVPSAKPSPAAVPPRREAPLARTPPVEPAPSSPGRSSSPAETGPGDGAAAVDWLLKESRGAR